MKLLLVLICCVVLNLLLIQENVSVEITGGKETVPHTRPYMVLIKGQEVCGGALIKKNWVLTAAHCKVDNKVEIILGAHSSQKSEPEQQKFGLSKTVVHPCYDGSIGVHDLQLLQLKDQAKLNKFIAVLPLPTSDENLKAGTKCIISGWGATKSKDLKPSLTLQETNVTIVDSASCRKIVQNNSNLVCANGGRMFKNRGVCKGDDGGPLICNNKFSGVLSAGDSCGKKKTIGIYTLLTERYRKWIKDTTGGAEVSADME